MSLRGTSWERAFSWESLRGSWHRRTGRLVSFWRPQYISGLLDNGLPLGRILALITGFDGELVPSFRNFASWLAVHNKQSRKRLSQLES